MPLPLDDVVPLVILFGLFFVVSPVAAPVLVGFLWGRRPGGLSVDMPVSGLFFGLVGVVLVVWALSEFRIFSGEHGIAYMLAAAFGATVGSSLVTWLFCWWCVMRRRRRGYRFFDSIFLLLSFPCFLRVKEFIGLEVTL